ncbi:hypothetical protein BG000_006221, partial [Podila horticola]
GMMSPVQKNQLLKQQAQQQVQQQHMIAQQQLAHQQAQQQMMQRQQLQQAQQLQQQQLQQTGLPPQLSQDRKQKVQQMGARGPGIQVHDARASAMNDIQHKANNQEFYNHFNREIRDRPDQMLQTPRWSHPRTESAFETIP